MRFKKLLKSQLLSFSTVTTLMYCKYLQVEIQKLNRNEYFWIIELLKIINILKEFIHLISYQS